MCSQEQLSITCCSNQSYALRWIVIPYERNDDGTMPPSRLVSSSGPGDISSLPIEIANKTFTIDFSRQSTNPLISILTIDSIITELNGTAINCRTESALEMTIIHVIDGNYACILNLSCSASIHDWDFNVSIVVILNNT